MVTEPAIYSDYKHHNGYDIAVEVAGPIKSTPADASDDSSHYVARYSIFHNGKEVAGSEVRLQQRFHSKEAAMLEAFSLGRRSADILG
jgi:hypothetical protein